MQILDGKALSRQLLEELKRKLSFISGPPPKLVVILVGEDPASQIYTQRKAKVAREIGMASELLTLPAETPQTDLLTVIDKLNEDEAVHGILVQLPLPPHINEQKILERVDPDKDVDGFHPRNLGRLVAGHSPLAPPCTPAGIMTLLAHYGIQPAGKHAVVVGRSTIVGKPLALLLLQANATVTICHSRTPDLAAMTSQADILVSAVGQQGLIGPGHVKAGATVIDVGINRTKDGKLRGDVDFNPVQAKAGYITPVPGGVGPMTIATLMANTLALYEARKPAP